MIHDLIIGGILGLMVGIWGGVGYTCLVVLGKGYETIIAELSFALQEWVDLNEVAWMLPINDLTKKMFDRSCKALNRARGLDLLETKTVSNVPKPGTCASVTYEECEKASCKCKCYDCEKGGNDLCNLCPLHGCPRYPLVSAND